MSKPRITCYISSQILEMLQEYDAEYRRVYRETPGTYQSLMQKSGGFIALARFLDENINRMKAMPTKVIKKGRPRKSNQNT